ncbi:MAG: helix-turn-helix transcriptional regulator [bacterium]|nr:helix-turn-helix transcriptional regulator [bacterium]
MKKEEHSELHKRIRQVKVALNLSQKAMANKVSISEGFMSDLLAGRSKPGFDFVFKMSKVLKVNLYYLVHGIEPMFKEDINTEPIISKKPDGGQLKSFSEIMWYAERSPMVKHTIVGHAVPFIYQNLDAIEKDIEFLNNK